MRLLSSLSLCALLGACGGDNSKGADGNVAGTGTDTDDVGGGNNGSVDADSDGYPDGEDCDDTDSAISPGASEICDGVDNDCDDLIDDADDSVEGGSLWYTDGDSDGFGDPDTAVTACEAPADAIADGTDCDDGDGAINPAATEVCDGADNDCDSLIDDDDDSLDTTTGGIWYADTDEDGFGDPDSSTEACVIPDGYVEDASDCDDEDENSRPDGTEVEGDRADNDCDPTTLDNPNGGDFDSSAASLTITGVDAFGSVGHAILVADFNGDGDEDVVVGSGSTLGTAYVFDGPVTASTTTDLADAALSGAFPTSSYLPMATLDIDGDGYDDLALGAAGSQPNYGSVMVAYGPFSGDTDLSTDADATVIGRKVNGFMGKSVALTTDVTGDGLVDLLVPQASDDAGANVGGAVFIFSGQQTGNIDLADAEATILGDSYLLAYGRDATVVDINADGIDDLVASALLSDAYSVGSAHVHYGPVSGLMYASSADVVISSGPAGFGMLMRDVGDLDGDGYEDLAAGAVYSDVGGAVSGGVYIFSGSTSPVSRTVADADAIIAGQPDEYFANELVGIGDYDFNGGDDLLVGASKGSASYTGAAYVFLSPIAGTMTNDDAFIRIEGETMSRIGAGLATTPDLDGDGRVEFWIGATSYIDTASTQGRAYLFQSLDL